MTKADTETPQSLADQARAVGEAAISEATRARDAVSQTARSAVDAVEGGRAATSERLEETASAVRELSESLPGGARVRQVAQTAADGLTATADYVRTRDFRSVVDDVEAVVKNNPGPALLVAAAFGFLLGRAMARSGA